MFHDGLKQKEKLLAQKVEVLKERDEELMKAIARCSELEAALKAKEDEYEVSKGVMAENVDLQARMATLTAELDRRAAEAIDLRGELSVKTNRLARAERDRATAISKVAALEDALRVCRSERENEIETSTLKVVRFEERIQDLEAELSVLNEQVNALKAEDVRRQLQPSTTHASADPVVSRELYEMWVHVEARLDVYKSLQANGKVFEVELRDVRVKACATRMSCGYDPDTPDRDNIDDDGADGLASDSWYNEEYAMGDDAA
ncbi:nuclear matrix constituent protein 1-like [Nicotiana sylvestris]|uniref:nuclear matrix constituent protein 1-like n=1 Tax=Nicotiana sylvestris TaxID=4096 RepID=UPI00388C6BED